jgi:CRISPR-associated protein Cas5d
MFEAVARLANGRRTIAEIIPQRVELCSDIRYERYVTNYGGPLRKPAQVKGGDNYQLIATALVDVCYRVHGIVQATSLSTNPQRDCHQLQSMFERRVRGGQSFYTPCLGWKEFIPSYFGPFRASTALNSGLNADLGSFLKSVFDEAGRVSPVFQMSGQIRAGVLVYQDVSNVE